MFKHLIQQLSLIILHCTISYPIVHFSIEKRICMREHEGEVSTAEGFLLLPTSDEKISIDKLHGHSTYMTSVCLFLELLIDCIFLLNCTAGVRNQTTTEKIITS